jgi:imidazolonepropionase
MMRADLLIHSAAQLVTCAGPGPKRGAAMREVGMIRDGAVAIADGRIVAVGASDEIRAQVRAEQNVDASGKVICPGFVDPHTHVVYAGDRIGEFEMRIRGQTYMEIMAAGGGIVSTMRAVRNASVRQLVAETRPRLDAMLHLGATTAEVKSGYGLDVTSELNMLDAADHLDATYPMDIVPTFLGAHAIPPEFAGRADDYTAFVINDMLPAAWEWYQQSHFAAAKVPCFVDVFCEQNAFDVDQSRRILTAGQALGFAVKAHVDEFTSLGGVAMALELNAISIDHLDVTSPDDIARVAKSDTVAVVIPAVNFNLGATHFADARGLIDAGAALALCTDINPGSAPCPSMPFVMALACRYQKLLPAEAMNASTLNAAYAIGMGDRIGSIETGKQADLLIVNATDYRHLAYQFGGNLVEHVIKHGQFVI